MHRNTFARSFALLLPAALWFAACASLPSMSGKKKDDGPGRVDDLLSKVERVQVEAVVAQDKAQGALEALQVIVEPDFQGDPVAAYEHLVDAIGQSRSQAEKLSGSIGPMKSCAESVFEQWTADLESFGSTSLRQRSQARLEETRARYATILTAAVSAQIAYDAFNADVRDHALFLEHDFNAAAVSMIARDVDALGDQAHELHTRLNACAEAAKAYISGGALRGQLEQPEAAETAPAKPATLSHPAPQATPAPRSTVRRKSKVGAPQPGAPSDIQPAPGPAPTSPESQP